VDFPERKAPQINTMRLLPSIAGSLNFAITCCQGRGTSVVGIRWREHKSLESMTFESVSS
jgi:hypothetical protein